MAVLNVHERLVAAGADAVGELLDTLSAGPEDRLWPSAHWPAMRLDRGLSPGSAGGHDPIRYAVNAYEPGARVRFDFTGPPGFHGFHEFAVVPVDAHRTLLRHTLSMRTTGAARLAWPLLYRPLHDALVEDALDRAEPTARPARWSPYVRLLRTALARRGWSPSDK
ncbi:SRPBCC family protein [Streptomyces griseus]|uniref:SRPBCC family protein n=1 Tax=Streptomyces griseus TaxID=1911 RepID=UPI0036593ADF